MGFSDCILHNCDIVDTIIDSHDNISVVMQSNGIFGLYSNDNVGVVMQSYVIFSLYSNDNISVVKQSNVIFGIVFLTGISSSSSNTLSTIPS